MKLVRNLQLPKVTMSPPARVVWIEILPPSCTIVGEVSPPARVVWIEITPTLNINGLGAVATREGGVD